MNVLSLDLSTKPGWALFIGGKLVRYGTLWADKTVEDFGQYPWNYVLLSQHIAQKLYRQVIQPAHQEAAGSLHVVIEETTSGASSNYSQKKLEFIHYSVLQLLQGMNVWYVKTGSWRSVACVKLNDQEKALNKQVKEFKEKTGKKLAKLDLDGSGTARVVGRVTFKHVAMRRVREEFKVSLDLKSEDMAEAILLGHAFLKGVKLCDGGISRPKKNRKQLKGSGSVSPSPE